MDKQQAETAAGALLAPHRERLDKAQEEKLQRAARFKAQQRRGAWAFVGLASGALIGLLATGSIWPAALVGLAAGALVGFTLNRA